MGFPGGASGEASVNAGEVDLIPGSRRFPGESQLIHSKEVPFSDGLKGDTFHFRTLNFPW